MTKTPKTTITYFDFPGSRGEECRLALHLAGVEFTDERLKGPEFAARKAELPFGALPVLTVEGQAPLAQTNVILRLIGREHGLHPSEPWVVVREEAIMEAVEDLRHHMGPMARIKDPDEKRRAREEAAGGYLQQWATFVERQLAAISDGPFVSGGAVHVADLKLFVALSPYLKGSIDHVPTDVFARYRRLVGVHDAVKAHPGVQAWYAKTR